MAFLILDPVVLAEDPGLAEAVGSVARMSLENERLSAQVRAQLDEVRDSRARLVEAGDAARRLRDARPRLGILVLSQYVETRHAVDLIRSDPAGIGYLLKDRVVRIEDIADAVRRVAAGGSVIDPEVVGRLLGRPRAHLPLDELTRREHEILGLMAEGRSNQGIAEALVLESKTVEGHVSQIFGKLGLERETQDNRRVLAVVEYLRGR